MPDVAGEVHRENEQKAHAYLGLATRIRYFQVRANI